MADTLARTSPHEHPSFPLYSSNAGAEGLKGIIMAFTMALVFRAFVIEGFEIPTGSMAPTLLGQHTMHTSPASGYTWPVGPIDYYPGTATPLPIQGGTNPLNIIDPMTGADQHPTNLPLRGGDRVFILKYIWPFYTPSRYDVVVFKNPRDPTVNYIKRLTGIGPEEVALVDGDVFSRKIDPDGKGAPSDQNTWLLPGWTITRKPESAQRAMWQTVFDTQYTPLNPMRDGRAWFKSPWTASGETAKKWEIEGKREYTYSGDGPSSLAWDNARKPINDFYGYNEAPQGGPNGRFPVSDIRMNLSIRPERSGQSVAAVWVAREHEFRAEISGTTVSLKMRPVSEGAQTAWKSLGTGTLAAPLQAGVVTNLDFWHADQALSVFVNDARVAYGTYDWTPAERIKYCTGATAEQLFGAPPKSVNLLEDPSKYSIPKPHLEFGEGRFTLTRLALERDIHYQAARYQGTADATPSTPAGRPHTRAGQPAAATHPRQPLYLAEGEFFFNGDNSPQSLDARLWDEPYPWMAKLEPKTGVVTRDALIGRAFVVYWPGLYWKMGKLPLPDTGRVRQVR